MRRETTRNMQAHIWGPLDAVTKCTGSCDGRSSLTAERLVFVLMLNVIDLNFRIMLLGINEESIFYAPFSSYYCQHFNVFVDIFSILCLTTDPIHQGHEKRKEIRDVSTFTAQHVRAATRSIKCERQ